MLKKFMHAHCLHAPGVGCDSSVIVVAQHEGPEVDCSAGQGDDGRLAPVFKVVPQGAPGGQVLLNLAGEVSSAGAVQHDRVAEPSELSECGVGPGCQRLRQPGQFLKFGDDSDKEDALLVGEGVHRDLMKRQMHCERDQGAGVREPDLRLGCRWGCRFGVAGHKSMLSKP